MWNMNNDDNPETRFERFARRRGVTTDALRRLILGLSALTLAVCTLSLTLTFAGGC